jgi:hypothetical protein
MSAEERQLLDARVKLAGGWKRHAPATPVSRSPSLGVLRALGVLCGFICPMTFLSAPPRLCGAIEIGRQLH